MTSMRQVGWGRRPGPVGEWTLYWPDRNSRFHQYEPTPPTSDVGVLLEKIDRDPMSIFWG
jgi:hypothetical protein